jgi:hypothetical protein
MRWKRAACAAFSILCAQVAILLCLHLLGLGAPPAAALDSPQTAALGTVHLHGQIRDTGGAPRQGVVAISTYLGPDITQTISTADGFYDFDLPESDHYVATVFPYQRAALGSAEIPIGFLDRWERVNRTTETDLTLDVIVKPGGSILLDAYNPQGNRMFSDDFPGSQFFVVYPLGTPPVSDPLHVLNHQRPLLWGWEPISGTTRNPAVLMLPEPVSTTVTNTFAVWGLWTVPDAGTVMLEMDNGGLGFSVAASEVVSINVACELARTEYRKAQQKYDAKVGAGYVFSATIATWLTEAHEALDNAEVQLHDGDGRDAAMSAYLALTPAIRAKEEIVLQAARQDIESKRRLPVTINVVGADAKPIGDVQVAYQQTRHDFILSGNWGGDSVPVGDTPDATQMVGNVDLYAGIAKQIGFEYVNYPPYPGWGVVQREWPDVPYRLEDGVGLHQMAARGLGASALNTIWMYATPLYYPSYVVGKDYPYVRAAAVDFISTTVSQYAGKIRVWNLMNEPDSANGLAFTPTQMLDFTKSVLAAGKAADPQAVMFVNLSTPGLGFYGNGPGDESGVRYSTHDYLHQMLAAGVRPDAIGIQFYYGAYIPPIDLGTVSDLLDSLAQEFDIPFFISEFEYPTHEEYPGLVNISSYWGWHQGHTDQAQADWAVGVYTLAMSKPSIIGANWSMSYDLPAYRAENGRQGDGYLHRDGLTPRPMAYALGDLFRSWTVSGTAQTGGDGRAGFSAFGGEYQLTLTAPNASVRQETVHVGEGLTNTFTFVFDQDQTLAANQLAAAASLTRARSALAWAGNLGKTSNVAEARTLTSQAQTAHTTGHYWNASLLSQQARAALAFKIDGQPDDWADVSPLYSESGTHAQAGGRELRRFYGTLDDSALVMQFEFDTPAPRRELLFSLDTNADGGGDYAVTASPTLRGVLFFSQVYTAPATIFTHLIPSIDVVYSSTVEIRIPLADLGDPDRVEVVLYRENIGDGTMSGLVPSLGVVAAPPWRAYLPLVAKNP